jgi:hypothetical protein
VWYYNYRKRGNNYERKIKCLFWKRISRNH